MLASLLWDISTSSSGSEHPCTITRFAEEYALPALSSLQI
jgi:hypothetical protein